MNALGTGGWLAIGVALLIIGWLLKSNLLEAILDIFGVILMVVGLISIVIGVISIFKGKRGGVGSY